ncbi:MAG TPA: tyrosine-type recombinase/integrase [Pseudonocardiaceae bacterium]|nr:tyrosine-type recombinase/integrase [Pseudonocardiaceae bacterium]
MDETQPQTVVWHLLIDRWHTTLRAKALSKETIRGYLFTARRWATWLADQGHDLEPAEVTATHIEDFIADIIDATSASNAAYNYRNLRVFWAWLTKREKITTGNPMDATEPPATPKKLTPIFTEHDQTQLLDSCAGRDFLAVRDRALILLFWDTGARVSEVGNMDADDVRPGARQARLFGKGSRERLVGYSPDTGLALARYLKARAKLADTHGYTGTALWLGRRGKPLSVNGLKRVLARRGGQAELAGVHAHRFRHNFAHEWKLRQGSDEGLMAIGGWSSNKMAQHYGEAARAQRALLEQQDLMLAGGGR